MEKKEESLTKFTGVKIRNRTKTFGFNFQVTPTASPIPRSILVHSYY